MQVIRPVGGRGRFVCPRDRAFDHEWFMLG